MKERIGDLIRRIPGVSERTEVQADFVDGRETVATVRAGTKEVLREGLETACAHLARETILDGEIIFSAEKKVNLPLIGEVVVEREGFGRGPEALLKVLEKLP